MTRLGDRFRIDRRALALLAVLPLLAGLVLGANQTRAGAFMPWPVSIGYWLINSFATWWLIAIATWLLNGLLRPWHPPRLVVWLGGAITGSFAARPAIYAITDLFRPLMRDPVLRSMMPWRLDLDFLLYYLTNWSLIIAMWVVACAITEQWRKNDIERASSPKPESDDDGRQPVLHGLLLRLPPAIGRDVVALQAEDHYVRVHTRLGNVLMHGSLSEAIADVERSGIAGQRTHRSWWIAHHVVVTRVQRGRHVFLELINGVEAPVSITYRQMASASGLLAT